MLSMILCAAAGMAVGYGVGRMAQKRNMDELRAEKACLEGTIRVMNRIQEREQELKRKLEFEIGGYLDD